MIGRIASALVMWALLLWATSAFSAGPGQVDVCLDAVQVQGAKPVPAAAARPDDVIDYRVTYRNPGKVPAKQVNATLQVPPGEMAYQDGGATPASLSTASPANT